MVVGSSGEVPVVPSVAVVVVGSSGEVLVVSSVAACILLIMVTVVGSYI